MDAGSGGAAAERRFGSGRAGAAARLLFSSAVLILLAAGCGRWWQVPFRDHHVVLINIETLRADCCGAYGGPPGWTPEIDSLAARGVLVERAYTVAPWTRPSVASLWTGLYPSQHGVDEIDPDRLLPEEAHTLAERFAAAGYRTFGAVTNANLSPDLGFAQGFEEYRYRIGARGDTLAAWALDWVDRRIAEHMAGKGGEGEKGPPLFLALHFDEPHGAFFQTAFRADVDGKSRAEMIRRAKTLTDGERIAALEAYRARVAAVDRAVGDLVRALESRLGPDLLVVITADHGEEWFDHGGLFHGFTLYEELLRVPLILVSPAMEPARRPGPVRSVDLLPTLAAWTGADRSVPKGGGRAVGRAILGAGSFPREVLAETRYERGLASRMTGEIKYIYCMVSNDYEVYDLRSDPRERRDLSARDTASAEKAVSALLRRLEAFEAGSIAAEEEGRSLDGSKRRRLEAELRSIGYFGSGGGGGDEWPRGKRIDWRDLYARHLLLRSGAPEIVFEGETWKGGLFSQRRIGGEGASLTATALFRDAWILLGAHPWSGVAEIVVDGELLETVDLYQPREGNRQVAVPIRLAAHGPHTIRIRSTGERNGNALDSEILFDGIAIVLPDENRRRISGMD